MNRALVSSVKPNNHVEGIDAQGDDYWSLAAKRPEGAIQFSPVATPWVNAGNTPTSALIGAD